MGNFKEKLNKALEFLEKATFRVSLQEKIFFARHLSIIIKAGMPLMDALTMLKKQTESRSMEKILTQVIKDVSEGQFLSASLERYKNIFGDLFINMIRVGEASGVLPENLDFLSQELKKKREMRKKVVGALIYPAVILVATFGVIGTMAIMVFPKIFPVFATLNVELPMTTKILIKFSDALSQYTGTVASAFLVLIIAIWFLLRIKIVRYYSHRFLLRAPLVGGMITSVNMSNFSRTLGLLLKSGVKIVEAINITAATLNNLVYRKELKEVAESIQKGELISQHLTSRKSLFPKMATNMIAVGENTGNLSETLLYLSEFYESEVAEMTKNLSNTLEPVLMVFMGVAVGFVAISIIMPIYKITQTMGR